MWLSSKALAGFKSFLSQLPNFLKLKSEGKGF